MASLVSSCIAAGFLALACFYRIAEGKVPNALCLAALGIAPLLQWWQHGAAGGFSALGTGAAFAALLGFFFRRLGVARGGDVKLMLAFGALAGPDAFAGGLICAGLLALLIGAGLAVFRRTWRIVLLRVAPVFTLNPVVLLSRVQRDESAGTVPFAVLVALGGSLALLAERMVAK